MTLHVQNALLHALLLNLLPFPTLLNLFDTLCYMAQ
jgi:hypothetical protein